MNFKTFLGGLLMAASTIGTAWAQNWPSKPVSLIVPYPAGGPSDFFARKPQPDAAARLGQTMIIENIGGAGGSIGLSRLINAPADGHLLALGSPMELVLAPMAIQGVKYKPEDFRLVAQFASTTTVLAVRNSLNVKTVDELLAAPEQWHHARGWAPRWEAPDPWDPWYQTGSATWGDVTVRFTIAVKQGSYALLVGYQAEGDEKWKRYRCHFPAARPSADAIGHAIARSIGVWLAYRWPEGPCENP